MGNLAFLVLRDAVGLMQVVTDKRAHLEQLDSLSPESAVFIEGEVRNHAAAPGGVEVALTSLNVICMAEATCPVDINRDIKLASLTLSSMLDYRALTLRNPKVRAVFKIQAAICQAFRDFLTSERFTEIHSPKIVATGTEGGANLFKLDYFGIPAYLAQSPQFYKQLMIAVFERVFEVGPVFRAETHDTSRHLNEYTSLDLEMGFIESEDDVIALQIRLLHHIFQFLGQECRAEIELYGCTLPQVTDIPVITLADAFSILQRKGWSQTSGNHDLDPAAERLICQHLQAEAGSELIFIKHYPLSSRPFYTMPSADNTARSFDLLFRGLEITTGGQRIHRYGQLKEAITSRGMSPERFESYLDAFRFGMPPHGGLAIGLERLTKQLLDLPNVRLASAFPRDRHRLTP